MGSIHGMEKQFRCNICAMEFARSEKVKYHFASHHPGVVYDLKAMRIKPVKPPTPRASLTSTKKPPPPGEAGPQGRRAGRWRRLTTTWLSWSTRRSRLKGDGAKPYACLQCPYSARDVWVSASAHRRRAPQAAQPPLQGVSPRHRAPTASSRTCRATARSSASTATSRQRRSTRTASTCSRAGRGERRGGQR